MRILRDSAPADGNGNPPASAPTTPPATGHPAAVAAVTGQRTEADVKKEIRQVQAMPAETVKDERWIETRISELENELNDLRKLKGKSAATPPAPPVKKDSGRGFMGDWLAGEEED